MGGWGENIHKQKGQEYLIFFLIYSVHKLLKNKEILQQQIFQVCVGGVQGHGKG